MIVTELRTTAVSLPYEHPIRFATREVKQRDFTIVELHTDSSLDGLAVVGFGVSEGVSNVVESQLAKSVIGEDPMNRERIWTNMYREVYRERKGIPIVALGAVDIAIWDLIGKYLNLPIWKMLGGYRKYVPCYASGGYYLESKNVAGLAQEVSSYLDMGFTAVKIKVGGERLSKDIERVKAAREVLGPDGTLIVDANNAYDSNSAILAGREFEKFDIFWLEEPVWPEDLRGSAKVAASLHTPIASGELEYLRYGFRDLIENKAVDIIQPDAAICGGISEWIKIANFASAFGIPNHAS